MNLYFYLSLIFQLDIDECLSELNECQKNTKCLNIVGSYKCVCKDGFEGNGIFCEGFY